MRSFTYLAALALGLAACGGNVVAGTGGAGTDTSTGSGGGAAAVDCKATGSGTFPTFDKTCAADGDCVTKLHQINCCGTQAAVGVATSAAAAFDAAEAACESQYPGCGCAEGPTTAEDGKTAMNGDTQIQVACTAGQCMTFIP